MATIDCESCQDFKEYAPEYVQNGLSDAMSASLQNDTGLIPRSGHDDCEDLNTINDCTIGTMDSRLESFEACDWREYMHELVPNLYMLLKSIISAICGIWTNIHSLWRAVNTINTQAERIDCLVNYMNSGFTLSVTETTDTTTTHCVAGEGVSFLDRGAATAVSDLYLQYIGGAMIRGGGAVTFYSEQFTDADGTVRAGNPVWATTGDTVSGNELIYELRIKLSEHPQIGSLYGFFGTTINMRALEVAPTVTWGGSYAAGQHGSCNGTTGDPNEPSFSRGHLVPDGWVYVQLRAQYIHELIKSGDTSAAVTPRYLMGIRFNHNAIEC